MEQQPAATPAEGALDKAYRTLVNEEDARVCRDISADACRVVPGNFFLQIAAQFFTKLGDAIANPKTVLAWVLSALSAPGLFTAFLVPVRESGSLLPQLLIASFVRRRAVRKWTYVLGNLLQGGAVLAMAGVALTLEGAAAGAGIIAALVLFSLARGLCSVASKDVLGKTVPKTRRGQVNGWSAAAAGLVTVGVGLALWLGMGEAGGAGFYALLLAGAAALWVLGAGFYAAIREEPGETAGGANAIREAVDRLSLLAEDPPFRRFVLARALLLCSALTAPFIVMLAYEQTGAAALALGLFVIADGLADLLSAPFWGRFADASSRRVMIRAGLAAALVGIALVALVHLLPGVAGHAAVYPVFFFLLAVAHAGVRMGRKTYVVDLAGGNKRTDYVAVSNTVIGVVLLLTGLIGALTAVMPITGVILILSAMGLAGAWLSARLPEVTEEAATG
ncbi:MAG: MFS transporter [Halorhodospira halophila]|uniref:MFS transporter n=1 Tax=Halorhodospira TaxID=85108 RepID=UPI0019139D21|nr:MULTISPECIES: MFS transporter [Halorhodospira]MBK5943171.1 MFS transporter [Halorhodospira halophila]MCC3751358.1 MFS transporter [Halorhodospira halophila]MCG5533425.1 MFS transporter [Halorhodospira sp. 9621]MCG5538623.1 MFS transporter [Halorhodospira sp. 9622]MCG5540404.1 MFS transporter [Halorhodospira sp. M39old]